MKTLKLIRDAHIGSLWHLLWQIPATAAGFVSIVVLFELLAEFMK